MYGESVAIVGFVCKSRGGGSQRGDDYSAEVREISKMRTLPPSTVESCGKLP
jgi:hypothetical protein